MFFSYFLATLQSLRRHCTIGPSEKRQFGIADVNHIHCSTVLFIIISALCDRAVCIMCLRVCACVFKGLMSIIQHRRAANDLGHPLCDNLRNGNWLMDYTANRLLAYPATTAVRLSLLFMRATLC